jgi:hypothetical protein
MIINKNDVTDENLKDHIKIREFFENTLETDSIENNSKEELSPVSVSVANTTNVVSGKKLRKIQNQTLREAREFLSKTFGPMGSNTKIIKGNTKETINSSYSKDGLKVLQNISNSGPIERA